ncbi:hypothetical protein C8R44DRAFT_764429 [Mycena epipterygia]|nr:hypothetical protein C8R44DRAFT_764429 [Mycena epipterygia]
MDRDETLQPSRRSRWLPVTVLGAGTILIAAPLFYLWRVGKPKRISLNSLAAAPPRRGAPLSSGAAASTATSRFTLPAAEFPLPNATAEPPPQPRQDSDWDDADWGVPPAPPDPNDNFNAAFYTFRAFGAATLIVGSIAFGGIWGLRNYLDVDNAEDYGVKMRLAIMERMPLLALRMRNALMSPESEVDLACEGKLQPTRAWNWDGAQDRLSAAFDKGGLGAWADVAAREVEEEARLEMERREQLKTAGLKKTG